MGWFDQSPAGNMGIYGATPPIAQEQAAPQIDINYAAKKRIADALRKKADAAAKQQGTQFSDTIVSEGVNGAPGQVQVNYGGILANALTPWLNQRGAERLGEEAGVAEAEASTAQRAALGQLLGRGDLSAKDAILAQQELGVDVSSAVKDPDAERSKAMAMIAQNPAVASLYVGAGVLSQAEVDSVLTAQRDAATFKTDEEIRRERETYRAPTYAPERIDALEQLRRQALAYQMSGNQEGYTATLRTMQDLQNTKPTAVRPNAKVQTSADTNAVVEGAQRFLETVKDPKTFTTQNRAGAALKDIGNRMPDTVVGSVLGTTASVAGGALENEQGLAMNKAAMDNVIAQAKQLYPVSNSDMLALKQAMPNIYSDQKAAIGFAEKYLEIAKKSNANMRLLEQGKLPPDFDLYTAGGADFDAGLPAGEPKPTGKRKSMEELAAELED